MYLASATYDIDIIYSCIVNEVLMSKKSAHLSQSTYTFMSICKRQREVFYYKDLQ